MKNLLMNWTLGRKFTILGVLGVALLAAPLAMYLDQSFRDIATARTEAAGIPPAKALLRVIQLAQMHRGLSANVLGGNTGMEPQRADNQRELEQSIENASIAIREALEGNVIAVDWKKSTDDWRALAQNVVSRRFSGSDSYVAHTRLIAEHLRLLDGITDHFGLSLDPEASGYHLIMGTLTYMPNLTEVMGQMRGRGSLVLAQKKISDEERGAIAALAGKVQVYAQATRTSLQKAMSVDPELKKIMEGTVGENEKLADQAVKMTREKILDPVSLAFPPGEYFALISRSIDAQFNLNSIAMVELDKVLAARIHRLQKAQWTILGTIAILFALAFWLGVFITRSVTGPMAEAVRMARALAEGDLTLKGRERSRDETGQLLSALDDTVARLNGIVSGIRGSTETIGTASREIASGNSDLSSRTEEQASSLEETASSMEELTSTVKQNAENARQANQLAVGASDVAVKGGEVVRQVVDTMSGISDSSKKIADIIGVIDGIAFQTNILALNAAVEAARAGEQGRGFAVVASEVRNLAQRSAAAAKEIKQLIEDSVHKVDAGAKLVDEAGSTMDEIVASVKRVTDIMAEITAASQEQSSGIEQVNQAITQMDDVTQQNAALVEQAAAASESMQEQARQLAEAVAVFRVQAGQGAGTTVGAGASAQESVERRSPGRAQNVARLPARRAKPGPQASEPRATRKAANSNEEWEEF